MKALLVVSLIVLAGCASASRNLSSDSSKFKALPAQADLLDSQKVKIRIEKAIDAPKFFSNNVWGESKGVINFYMGNRYESSEEMNKHLGEGKGFCKVEFRPDHDALLDAGTTFPAEVSNIQQNSSGAVFIEPHTSLFGLVHSESHIERIFCSTVTLYPIAGFSWTAGAFKEAFGEFMSIGR